MNNSYIQQGYNVHAKDGVRIHDDIEQFTLEAGLDAMRELDLVSFEGKWNINETGANANIENNTCTTYIAFIFGEPRVKGMSGHAARTKNIPQSVRCRPARRVHHRRLVTRAAARAPRTVKPLNSMTTLDTNLLSLIHYNYNNYTLVLHLHSTS